MNISDFDKVKKLSDEFFKTVMAMRSLGEHSGALDFSFGTTGAVFGGREHVVKLDAHDIEYSQTIELLRAALKRRVVELADRLGALGVKVDA